MHVITDPHQLRTLCWEWRCRGDKAALVPTMGFFHQGHLSLMRWARQNSDRVVVSLFVNPAQFGPGEDLDSYPVDWERDRDLAEQAGVDLLFLPEASALYAPAHATWVEVPELSAPLCGRTRPHHFRGVCTIVAKLLLLTLPEVAVFGQKDWQQLAIIRRMVVDLGFPVRIEGRPIVREQDGLAMSSRNAYLDEELRARAPLLYAGLCRARQWADRERDPKALLLSLRQWYEREIPEARIDYLELVDPDTLARVETLDRSALLAAALHLGRARLIDNLLLGHTQ